MRTITKMRFLPFLAIALLLDATLAASRSGAALALPPGTLAATKSGNGLILSFPTTSPDLYTVQTCPDLLHAWTNVQSGIQGDGTVKMVTISNAVLGDRGFY